jgi:group II intron reverse transcriptase/maturase/CRISPR-associated endonuclease Cas1
MTEPRESEINLGRTCIFRVRIVLRITAPTRLHAHHAAILYALLAQAHAQASGVNPCVPDGVLLDAPEQARLWLAKDSEYAFGFTLLAGDSAEATRLFDSLVRGLRKLGRSAKHAREKLALGGNFDLLSVFDLVAGERHRPGRELRPIAPESIEDEVTRAAAHSTLTLRFLAPLRAHRSKHLRRDGYQYFDRELFQPRALLQRLTARLQRLGLFSSPELADSSAPTHTLPSDPQSEVKLQANRLVWLDLSYGPRQTRKALGGAVGEVVLSDLKLADIRTLVWGQYVRIGESTRFGFGRYRINELGPEPFACRRAVSLLSLVANHPSIDESASRWELAGGEAREAARSLEAGDYAPQPHFRVEIPKPNGDTRVLSIPSRLDRVLQRGLLEVLGPALDLFLEESSVAYRRGLGRHTAARRLQQAFANGYRWALRADFLEFFDSIEHDELSARIAAYVGDDDTTEMLMRWVRAGSPSTTRGIPTGAPLSPLLANLFLDEFDEAMGSESRRLVRYADDFLILFKEQAEADRVLADARRAAEQLQLELNRDKSRSLALGEPFEFLGFRFAPRESWELSDPEGPRPIEQLGWTERKRGTQGKEQARLPGESELALPLPGTLIVGPGLEEILVHGENLQFRYGDQRPLESIPLVGLRELIVIGPVGLPKRVVEALRRHMLPLVMVDELGRRVVSLEWESANTDALGAMAQVDAYRDEKRRLALGRQIIHAKLHNYSTLAAAYRRPAHARECELALEKLATAALNAASLDELLGYEGRGGAIWYGNFGSKLPAGYSWERRVAPDASDPPNILLNLAQTVLYRWTEQAIQEAQLIPTLGLLHVARAGHSALASDLQEPFRHLMDRAALEALRRIRPEEFEPDERGPFPVRIKPRALREALGWIHRILALPCHGVGQSEPLPYRLQIWKQVRSLRRALLNSEAAFEPFRHP